MDLPEKAKPLLPAVKVTAIGTAVVIGIALQIMAFKAFGDILTSAALFGLGYLAAKISK